MEARGDQVKLRIPLFSMWLKGRGQRAVPASFGERETEVFFRPAASGVPDRDILSAAEDLFYRDEKVNEIKIKVWLQQFGEPDNQILAFKLLERLKNRGYFSSGSLVTHFKHVHSRIVAHQHAASVDWAPEIKRKKVVSNIFVTSFDSPGKSGSSLLYAYRNANQISRSLVGDIDEAVRFLKASQKPIAVVFVDDFIGTGGTCIEGFGKFTEALGGNDKFKEHAFYVAALAATSDGIDTVNLNTDERLNVIEAKLLGSAERAFSPDAGIFSSEEELQECRSLCENIGRELEPKHPLGYEDSQSLILFPHSCPNNTLPLFYKSGREYKGQKWVPLFPR